MKNILFIVGSLRKESYNLQLSKYVSELLKGKASITYLDFRNIPFMNQDLENPDIESIKKIKEEVSKADAIWIFTPEYNHSIPGLLKNVLDWLSRKIDGKPNSRDTVLKDKKTTYSGVAWASGSKFAQDYLKELLPFIQMNVMDKETSKIKIKPENVSDGILTYTEEEKATISKQVEDFLSFIEG